MLSYFEVTTAARASLFCKTWYRAWLSCPTLDFGSSAQYSFSKRKRRKKFLKFMKSTLQRYQKQKTGIVQLTMPIITTGSYSASIMDECIGIAVQNGVRRLELQFCPQRDTNCSYALPGELVQNGFRRLELQFCAQRDTNCPYALPGELFQAKTLRELMVHGSISGSDNVLWSDNKVMFNNLQALHLAYIYLNDDMLKCIIKGCPLINELLIKDCKGLARIKVNNLYNLKKFTVSVLWSGSVEIEAPKLQDFDFRLGPGCSLDLYTTQELKYLSIFGTPRSATFFDNFMHKFPKLEDLSLTCSNLEKIDISSHSLKRVILKYINKLREVKINAPSMLSFQLFLASMTFFPDVSLTHVSSQLKSEIIWPPWNAGTCELSKAKGFLAKLVPSKISIMLSLDHVSNFDSASMKIPISPAIEVENLHFREPGFPSESTFADFLDFFFMICHPKAITIIKYGYDIVPAELIYKNLIARRDQGLKEVTLEIYDESKDKWRFKHRFCYRFEWEAHAHI